MLPAGEPRPLSAHPPPRVLVRAASKVADSTAVNPAGPVSAAREEQLRSLLGQREAGLVVGEEYAAQRRSIIHAEE